MSNHKRNLNNHKGKLVKEKRHRYNPPVREKLNGRVRGREISFLAVDTNIIFHLIDIFEGKQILNSRMYSNLLKLMDNSVFGYGGRINRKGKFVMMLLPAVMDELKNRVGNVRKLVREFIEDRMLLVSIDEKQQKEFDDKVRKIMAEYKKNGLFLDQNGKSTIDGKIMAQAAVLNLDILTQDHHFGVYDLSKEKIEIMKHIHEYVIGCEQKGTRAEPQNLNTFFTFYYQGKPVSRIENRIYLSEQTLTALHEVAFAGQNTRALNTPTTNPRIK